MKLSQEEQAKIEAEIQAHAKEGAHILTQGLAGLEDPETFQKIRNDVIAHLPNEARWKMISLMMNDAERGDFIGMLEIFRKGAAAPGALAQIDSYLRFLRMG